MLVYFLNIFFVGFFWRHVKRDRKGNGWHQVLEDSQMSLCINSAANGKSIFAQVVPIGNIYAVMSL
jgi:hypothetical protein